MKRFLRKSKHFGTVVLTVDDEDAHLLRNYVWTVSGSSTPQVIRKISGVVTCLSHVIANPKADEFVRHINGCQLDFRRINLLCVRLRKYAKEAGAK